MIGKARNITKSDVKSDTFSWVLVTTTPGDVVILSAGGEVSTLTDVPVGVWVPVGNACSIMIASTAVGFIVA